MKKSQYNISTFFSIASIVLLFGYIAYNESKKPMAKDAFTDEEVALEDNTNVLEDYSPPTNAIAFDLPEKVSFADEAVPLTIPDVRERLDKELQINCYLHSNTIFLIKRAHRWLPQMEKILKQYNIPDDFKYLPLIESNLLNAESPKAAVGFWQILKEPANEFGLEVSRDVDERYDPLKATEAACKYLLRSYRKFNDWALVAASYNRGIGGIDRAMESQHVKSYYDLYLNDETSRYVFRIIAIKEIIEHPTRYRFNVNPKNLYQEESVKYVTVTESIKSLIDFANQQGINYKLLKRHNPWLREESLVVKKGKSYNIAIPSQQ